jgi:hypothetical protein
MLPWIMLSIMIAIGGLISVIWTAVEFYNSSHNTTATLVLVFGLLGVGKHAKNVYCKSRNTRK